MFSIKEECKKLPKSPGVYIMHDENDAILYVGKAVNLKNRVSQYFQSGKAHSLKIRKMVSLVSYFEYIVCSSELEALVLESNLIKENRPPYNTMLTDDKSYPYIKVTTSEAYPRLFTARDLKKTKDKYFGPYSDATAAHRTVDFLQRFLLIRSCNRVFPRDIGKERPCLDYYIGRCDAPCLGHISEESYRKRIDEAMELLSGKTKRLEKEITEKMEQAAEGLRFEEAAEYREIRKALMMLGERQRADETVEEDKDIIGLAEDGGDAIVQIFYMREGKLTGRDHFHMAVAPGDKKEEILLDFLKQFYSGTPFLPKEILIPYDVEEREELQGFLSEKKGSSLVITAPKKGKKEKLLNLAETNAKVLLEKDRERIKREEARTTGAFRSLQDLIGLPELKRVEAYDISNISGFDSTGSMVVYEKGVPKKSDYRRFRIKGVKGANDVASHEEVLRRRFLHGEKEREDLLKEGCKDYGDELSSFVRYPELILMDGGLPQIHAAEKVLKELRIPVAVAGMVKDDKHRTRGLIYEGKELPLDRHSELFHLITRIQDEVHRFAIEYHHKLRAKGQVHSVLDDIPGIGPSRKKALMRKFQDLDAVKSATIEELSSVPGMTAKAAESVLRFFHGEKAE